MALALGVGSAAVSAQEIIYKSVDAQGHVIYSDRPEPGAGNSAVAFDDAPAVAFNDGQAPGQSSANPSGADESAEPQGAATEAPPPIPDEEQPPCDAVGSLWIPGYWAWAGASYYWVPGAWVRPPRARVLWTPGYWVLSGNVYVFHPGYWGARVGYYGGVHYGHGYDGSGFSGGHWVGATFFYNTAVTRVNASVIRDTYRETPRGGVAPSRVSVYIAPHSGTAVPVLRERTAYALPHSSPSEHTAWTAAPRHSTVTHTYRASSAGTSRTRSNAPARAQRPSVGRVTAASLTR